MGVLLVSRAALQKKTYFLVSKLFSWPNCLTKRGIIHAEKKLKKRKTNGFCQTPVLGLGLGVDLTFTWDNKNNDNDNDKNNPHLNFMKGTVLGDKEQGVGIRDKG